MGGVLLAGWCGYVVPAERIIVVEPDAETAGAVRERHAVKVVPSEAEIPSSFLPKIVFFAVKPQVMDDVAPCYRRFAGDSGRTLFISIAAGRGIASFENHLGAETPIVRAMPNTPAAVGRGVTVACANGAVTNSQRAMCKTLFAAVGTFAWVDRESLLDPVTAVSGCGPAYVFLLVETLAEAGIAAGLEADFAMRLARATVSGSGELLRRSEEPAEVLRQNVTSPGGATAAALEILMAEGRLKDLLTRAVAAAASRARELSV